MHPAVQSVSRPQSAMHCRGGRGKTRACHPLAKLNIPYTMPQWGNFGRKRYRVCFVLTVSAMVGAMPAAIRGLMLVRIRVASSGLGLGVIHAATSSPMRVAAIGHVLLGVIRVAINNPMWGVTDHAIPCAVPVAISGSARTAVTDRATPVVGGSPTSTAASRPAMWVVAIGHTTHIAINAPMPAVVGGRARVDAQGGAMHGLCHASPTKALSRPSGQSAWGKHCEKPVSFLKIRVGWIELS